VDGTQVLAGIVASARGVKPVLTHASQMGSAAYWIGAQADAAFAGSDTVQIGSIGVVVAHQDVSGRETQAGVRTTEITAGRYKRVASQYGPLSEDGRASLQAQVDYLYSIFVDAVARARGVTEDKVLSDMADGRVFIGQQAVAAGLVDGVSTLADVIALAKQRAAGAAASSATPATPLPLRAEGEIMDRESVLAQAPELAAAFRDEGATAERQRILAVEAQSLPGHEALIAELKADGKTTGPDAAARVLAAEKAKLSRIAGALDKDTPPPLADAAAPDNTPAPDSPADPRQALHAKAKQYQAEHPGTDYLAALAAVAK
jgi:signal peptide peptidase SppA